MPAARLSVSQALLLDNQLCFALYSTSLSMTKTYKPLLGGLGLTYPQYLVMLALWEKDGLMVSEIGARLYLDSGTLTPLLKRLETMALIARVRDALDQRRVRVKLSAAGVQLKAAAPAIVRCVAAATQHSTDELVSLTRRLKALRTRLVP